MASAMATVDVRLLDIDEIREVLDAASAVAAAAMPFRHQSPALLAALRRLEAASDALVAAPAAPEERS